MSITHEYCYGLQVDPLGSTILFHLRDEVVAWRLRAPNLLWALPFQTSRIFDRTIVIEHQNLAIIDAPGIGLIAVDLEHGTQKWTISDEDEPYFTSLTVDPKVPSLIINGRENTPAGWRSLISGKRLPPRIEGTWVRFDDTGVHGIRVLKHRTFELVSDRGSPVPLEYEGFAVLDVAFCDNVLVIAGPLGERLGLSMISGSALWRVVDENFSVKRLAKGSVPDSLLAVVELAHGSALATLSPKTGEMAIITSFPVRPNSIRCFMKGRFAMTSQGDLVDLHNGTRENVLDGLLAPLDTFPRKRKLP